MVASFLIAILSLIPASTAINIQVNGNFVGATNSSIEVTGKDSIILISELAGPWFRITPTLKEYDNLALGASALVPVEYMVTECSGSETLTLSSLKPGTYLFGKGLSDKEIVRTTKPLHLINPTIVQIIVRRDDSYLGYLSELLNLPFIIPPKTIPGYGHQTDLRVGTDCAELAIYGRRRMGYNIPYGGPRGIYDYLTQVNYIKEGSILHFGHQVSVVYKDLGLVGILDPEDLLIHAFEDKVAIQKFKDTSLFDASFIIFEWKEFENPN